MIQRFNDYLSENVKNEEFLKKYHTEWVEKFPELRLFKLEAGDINHNIIWFYSIDKDSLDASIEIKKYTSSWSINFEISKKISTEDLVSNHEDHFSKNGLNYKSLLIQLKRIFTYIHEWNSNVYNKENILPLIENKNVK
jgi:hypothetical protein